ncbi:hypothetical protein MLD38_032552 [Melastoma candidum]|nr:hypothetical protein MLD38_032552 [Melastoma candidum]
MVPDTYGDSQSQKQSRDPGGDAGAEKLASPAVSEGRCPPDESSDDQELQKSYCLTCGEGGRLLGCSENSCPVAYHERCLNYKLDELGSFYCNYCIYKQMVEEVQKLRRKATCAKRKLSTFSDLGKDEQGGKKLEEERPQGLGSRECPCSGNDSKDNNVKEVDSDGLHQESELVNQLHEDGTGSDDLLAGYKRNKQKLEPVSGPTVASSSRGLGDETSGKIQNSEETAGPLVLVPRVMPQPLRALSSGKLVECDFLADQRNAHLCNPRNRMEETAPGVKRKRSNWSSEEEEMLKEGVRLFQSNDKKNLPWRKIREYGRPVFCETRTPSDLKDKWKTMTRRRR